MVVLGLVVAAACAPGGNPDSEYYEMYMAAEAQIGEMGIQLDSTMVRIRDLEGAIAQATTEIDGAEASAREAQLVAGRDPVAAEYHAVQAQTRLQRARTVLQSVGQ